MVFETYQYDHKYRFGPVIELFMTVPTPPIVDFKDSETVYQ